MHVENLISEMTLEEKVSLCSGKDRWFLKPIERLGIPSVKLSDGPHGLRNIKAVCFPTAAGLASSFDRNLIRYLGEILGEEALSEDISILLGPAINIKRSPLCGRNFEYFSEDPYLTGELAKEFVEGVQSKNVGSCPKHFAANNQEYMRFASSSEVDERTLREIYLTAFEIVIESKPWAIMCSYNKINGEYASENKHLLTEILREEWGFTGYVMSDWGAVNDRVKGLKAGLDLEMPSSNGINDKQIADAVKKRMIEEEILDETLRRILTVTDRYLQNKPKKFVKFNREKHHQIAREIARECIVLLKNNGVLPLNKEEKIAFIGEFAEHPQFMGGGSSTIDAYEITSALSAVKSIMDVIYVQGYRSQENTFDINLQSEALKAAKEADVAVVFVGLPQGIESESYDRIDMKLPDSHNKLIHEILKVQKNVVVILHNGSPVEMPWAEEVSAIFECYLGGEAVGGALVDLLFGEYSPCAKLSETFPLRLEDNPSYLNFHKEKRVEYREGIYVGYRWYDTREEEVLFPFGHGLSYTDFSYSNLELSSHTITDLENLSVTVSVKNIGKISAKEIVQLYVGNVFDNSRPKKELKNFEKIYLLPGETKEVSFVLNRRSFAYYDTELSDWMVPSGIYEILIGKSSRDIILNDTVFIKNTKESSNFTITPNTPMSLILRNEEMKKILVETAPVFMKFLISKEVENPAFSQIRHIEEGLPLRTIKSFSQDIIDNKMFEELIERLKKISKRDA